MDNCIKNLAYATMYQAVKDFVKATDKKRNVILKELRSSWMNWFTNGMSLIVAEQLENHPKDIITRMRKMKEDE